MSVTKLYTNYSVQIGASNFIDGITDLSLTPQLATMLESADGAVFPSFGHLAAGRPAARFGTLDLVAGLTQIGVTSTVIPASPGVKIFFRRRTAGGTLDAAGSGTHVSCAIANGIMVPRRLSASSGGNATFTAEIFGTQSGATAPFVYSAAANLPGNTPGVAQVWTIGKAVLNATTLDGLQGIDVDFGVSVDLNSKDSDIYPTFACVTQQRPSVRIRGVHIDQITTLTADGNYYTASQVVFYFRARAEGSTFVADGTTSHVKFTLGKCRVEPASFDGDPKAIGILLTPWQDVGGAVNPIAVNTASAIS